MSSPRGSPTSPSRPRRRQPAPAGGRSGASAARFEEGAGMNVLQVPEREFLAFHEAGHAVMATILRRPIHRASIRETHGLTGYVDFKHASSALAEVREEHRPILEADALILLAGRAAECERTLGSPLSHASLDKQNARTLLAMLEDSEEVVTAWMRYLLVRAQSMLQSEWPMVHAVAHALL